MMDTEDLLKETHIARAMEEETIMEATQEVMAETLTEEVE